MGLCWGDYDKRCFHRRLTCPFQQVLWISFHSTFLCPKQLVLRTALILNYSEYLHVRKVCSNTSNIFTTNKPRRLNKTFPYQNKSKILPVSTVSILRIKLSKSTMINTVPANIFLDYFLFPQRCTVNENNKYLYFSKLAISGFLRLRVIFQGREFRPVCFYSSMLRPHQN